MKIYKPEIFSNLLRVFTLVLIHTVAFGQIPSASIYADPSAKAISQAPLGLSIANIAVIDFKFTNEATSVNGTGQILPNSVRVTITFPATFAYTSVNTIPNFAVEDFNNQPLGTVHLINTSTINEGEVIDLLLNVRGTAMGVGTVTFNVSKISPDAVANTLTDNDNSSATFNTLSVLSVNLKSFDAYIDKCNAIINWQSATEDKFKKYQLEYSVDGSKFSNFYEANAKGNNSTYSTQHAAADGKAYYRLKMIDLDGSATYSKIISLNVNCNKNWVVVYPNPTAQTIYVNISTLNNLPTTVALHDAVDKIILTKVLQSGINKIDVSNISAGSYTLSFDKTTGLKNSIVIIKK